MSWWNISAVAADPEKVQRNADLDRDVTTALVELRRTMNAAHAHKVWHFDPVLAEVNDALKSMGD